MAVAGPFHVVEMAADEAVADRAKPLGMIHKAKVLLDLDVPKIVPITDIWRVQFIQKPGNLAFGRDLLEPLTAFDAKADIARSGVSEDAHEAFLRALQVKRG